MNEKIIELFSADTTIFQNRIDQEKFRKTPSKVAKKYSNSFVFLLQSYPNGPKTEELMFQYVAYRPTVYKNERKVSEQRKRAAILWGNPPLQCHDEVF